MTRVADIDPAEYRLPDEVSARLVSPALVVHLDRVRRNVATIIGRLGGRVDRWRPHVKTLKIPEVFAEVIGAGLRGFKCATIREARCLTEALKREGIAGGDLLVAHPLTSPALDMLGTLARTHTETRLSMLAEDPAGVDVIPPEVDVFVDVNVGMNRTGIPLGEADRILAVASRAGPRFRGIHAYDGHLHQPDREERRTAIFACYDGVADLVRRLTGSGIRVAEVVTAGTPSFPSAVEYEGFEGLETEHRLSPGTVVYHDLRSEEQNPELDLDPAAVVCARVVSHPQEQIVTVDAGSKSIAAEAGDPCAYAIGHPGLQAMTPSEEHLPFRVTDGEPPARGYLLTLVPRHVCPTVNLAETALLVDEGRVLQAVPVAARSHDLLSG